MPPSKSSKANKLKAAFEKYAGGKVLIPLRGHPDADALSSALAHQALLKEMNITTVISHIREISHQENRAHVKLFGIDKIQYDGSNLDFADFCGYSLVDSQFPDKEMEEHLSGLPALSLVDHHEKSDSIVKATYTDIDEQAGATATVYALYMQSLGLLEENDEHSRIATAMIHGIRSDTDGLVSAEKKDYRAMLYLSRYSDPNMLRKISIQPLSPKTMGIIMKAYTNMEIKDNYAISGVGVVQNPDRDAIPVAADFLLRHSGIDTVLVYGIVDEHIDCSLRTTDDGLIPPTFIKETFPEVEREKDYGGRRHAKGGFKLSLGLFGGMTAEKESADHIAHLVDRYVKGKFFAKLGIEE